MAYTPLSVLLLILIGGFSCEVKPNTKLPTGHIPTKPEDSLIYHGPKEITRNIQQDKDGNIWIAAFDGVFRYNGKSFTNITSKVSTARFFSVLQDSKGKMWFGSIGAGVYAYDGKTFQHFTSKKGLVGNEIVCIYEDKSGHIWFGANGGISRYDGTSFRNYTLAKDSIIEGSLEDHLRPAPPAQNEVNAIIQDKTGAFWFATRGNTYIYDGKTYIILSHQGKPFTNVRSVIEDQKGHIWFGGPAGLWRYDGQVFTNYNKDFVGYIHEDREGNIWTSSKSTQYARWVLSRYEKNASSSTAQPTVIEVIPESEANKGMIFGILDAADGNIWFGALDGVYRYDGRTVEAGASLHR